MNESLRDEIEKRAKETAAIFVEEYGVPFDPATSNWDEEAWQVDRRDLELGEHHYGDCWKFYQAALVAETERLCQSNLAVPPKKPPPSNINVCHNKYMLPPDVDPVGHHAP